MMMGDAADFEDLGGEQTVTRSSTGSVDPVYARGVRTLDDGEHVTAHADLDKEWYDDVVVAERCFLWIAGLCSLMGTAVEMGAPGGPPDDGSTNEVESKERGVQGEGASSRSIGVSEGVRSAGDYCVVKYNSNTQKWVVIAGPKRV